MTHVRLNHLRPLIADSGHEVKDVHFLLCMHHVHHGVDHYEGARPAHARAWGERKRPRCESPVPSAMMGPWNTPAVRTGRHATLIEDEPLHGAETSLR